MSVIETTLEIPVQYSTAVFGPFDQYVKKIEKTLKVTIVSRDSHIKVIGAKRDIDRCIKVLNNLLELAKRGNDITEQNVDYALSLVFEDKEDAILEIDSDVICRTITGKPIKPKTLGQKEYVDLIRNKMIVFGLGPAAIEAGEKLGFLPGDLQSKVDPYLRPLYDALYQIMGAESFAANMEKGLIEVAPLAYMRGRTLDNAFIILDEAQNTTPAQMKMFLTRIGFGSKVIITGDLTQKDLPKDAVSGLDVALKVLSKVDEIGFANMSSKDVVRHPLVQKIVKAYEEYEEKQTRSAKRREQRKTVRKKD